jgi:hypothetical protein
MSKDGVREGIMVGKIGIFSYYQWPARISRRDGADFVDKKISGIVLRK